LRACSTALPRSWPALLPSPSLQYYGLVPIAFADPLAAAAAAWPVDDLFLVTHSALRDVPRVRVVWDGLVELFRRIDAAP
jgi:hypothetical protein